MISSIIISLVALEHIFFLYLEMFAWTKPSTRKAFRTTKEFAIASKTLAANQGLYNGFLAAGLAWGLVYPDPVLGQHIQIFFLLCILIAAMFGGVTASKYILYIQGTPALLALLAVLFI